MGPFLPNTLETERLPDVLREPILAAMLTLTAASQAGAHSEGHVSIDSDEAFVSAVSAADHLTRVPVERDWSPLAESWSQLSTSNAKIMAIVDGDYVVAVTNPQDGRIFYILVAYNGAIVDANFTGTFPFVWDAQNPDTWTTD